MEMLDSALGNGVTPKRNESIFRLSGPSRGMENFAGHMGCEITELPTLVFTQRAAGCFRANKQSLRLFYRNSKAHGLGFLYFDWPVCTSMVIVRLHLELHLYLVMELARGGERSSI